jgi:hypothetical protein
MFQIETEIETEKENQIKLAIVQLNKNQPCHICAGILNKRANPVLGFITTDLSTCR